MKINKTDLLHVIKKLENSIDDYFPEKIEISKEDYYWFVETPDLYEPYKDISSLNITLGQLSFDWEELQHLLQNEELPHPHDFKKLSSILRILSEKTIW